MLKMQNKIVEESKIKYVGTKGVPHLSNPGNAVKKHTGSWRIMKPVVDHSRCISCKTCFAVCPDSAYSWEEKKPDKNSKTVGKPVVDYNLCKGCLICVEQCPVKCIRAERDLHEKE